MSKVFTKLFFPLCLLIAYSNITLAQTIILEEGFEGGSLPTGWTVVDADGDGQNWSVTTSSTSHSGSYYIMSRSWNTNPLNPNNYLITPLVEGATNIKYYFKVNVNYPYEHYAVMASTTGNALTNFQIIFEETATATNDWIERNINLPAGTKYVAFRHYNSTDQDYLALDDITIFSGNSACPPITNLTATSNPNNTVTLSWTNPPQSEWASDEPYYWFYDDEIEIGSDNTYNLNSWTTAELTEGVHSLGVQIGYYSTIAEDYICKADIIFVEVTITNVEEIKTSLFSAEIFPNPAKDVLNIVSDSEIISYELYDALGRLLINKTEVANTESIVNVSSLKYGMYMLRLNTEKGSGTFKLIIE